MSAVNLAKQLVADKVKEIEATKWSAPELPAGKALGVWVRDYKQAYARLEAIKDRFNKRGLRIDERGYVTWAYTHENRMQNAFNRSKQERIATAKRLKTRAELQLIGVSAPVARGVLEKLQKDLEAV